MTYLIDLVYSGVIDVEMELGRSKRFVHLIDIMVSLITHN
jgi:hypothetical protein